jgi:hypothetical protein
MTVTITYVIYIRIRKKNIVFVLYVLHPWLRPVKDLWNVHKFYSVLFYLVIK